MQQSTSRVNQNLDTSTNSHHLTSSLQAELQDIKNSRILNRKQIQKRLQNMKPAQYEKVISNLNSQNKLLQEEVKDLHEKVQQLLIAKKMQNIHTKNPQMEQEVRKAKKQLALKYESMNYLKQQVKKYKFSELTQEMRNKIKQYRNEVANAEMEIEKLKKQKEELTREYEYNCDALEEFNPKTENRDEKIDSLRDQNRNLKMKIQKLQENVKYTEKNSIEALEKYYNMKQQQQKILKTIIESKTSTKKIGLEDVKSMNIGDFNNLEKQVEQLRRQKKEAEKQLVNEKILKDQKKARLQKQARQNVQYHKDLLRKKMKFSNQLNLYQAKQRRQRDIIEIKEQKSQQINFQERGSQTDKIIPIDFRKQWLGNSDGVSFDDSLILDYRSHVFIKALMIYKNSQHISFIKFFYENTHRKRYQTKVPFDSGLLRKLQSKKYSGRGPAFLKTYKLWLTNDKVTKVQFIWSDGETVIEGWDLEGSTKFVADIDSSERPISMFGSFVFQGKNGYALESLGCEINRIDAQD